MSFFSTLSARWTEPEHIALHADGAELSFRELHERACRAAGWLASHGIGPRDVLALQLPRCPELLELHLGALLLGATTLPLNARYPAPEVVYYLEDSGARLAVLSAAVAGDVAERLDAPGCQLVAADRDQEAEHLRRLLRAAPPIQPRPVEEDAAAVLLYTSGTTGRPKGARITHANMHATVDALHQAWHWQRSDVLLHALPLTHTHGLFVAQHGALYAGATTRWLPRFEASTVVEQLHEHRCTVFMGVPTFYHRLLALPDPLPDLSQMRLFTSGSAPLPAELHRRFAARYGHLILERYGMTEVGIVLSNPYEGPRRPGTVGYPLRGVQTRIVDRRSGEDLPDGEVGELLIRGPSVFAGYLGRPEQTAGALRDGWMHSGDLATREQGVHRIVGRARDMVICGGMNIYPSEVEAVLGEHPAVDEVAVYGVPDEDLGERPVATVVPAPDRPLDRQALLRWARGRLAAYKLPRAVGLAEQLPRNTMGKVQKARLRQRWGQPVLRAGRPEDADSLVAFNRAMAEETEGMQLDQSPLEAGVLAAMRDPARGRYLVAERAGEVVGSLMITREWSDWRNRWVWWIQSVYVRPADRARGVYRALHDEVIRQARAAEAAGVRLYVDSHNDRAMKVYEQLGMTGDHYRLYEQMLAEPTAGSEG